jgi:uncharacterized protein YmfQ (DUF2313 family)
MSWNDDDSTGKKSRKVSAPRCDKLRVYSNKVLEKIMKKYREWKI